MRPARSPRLLRALLPAVLTLSACSASNSPPEKPTPPGVLKTPKQELALRKFAADCSDFLDYAADALTEQYLNVFQCLADGPCPVFSASPGAPPTDSAGAPAAGGAAPERVSQTNTQEAGVDEADIVKADAAGNLYVLSGQTLSVVEAFPPQDLDQRTVHTLDLAGGDAGFYAADFFLDETLHRLVVLGNDFDGSRGRAVNVVVDVSTPAAPAELGRLSIDGYGIDARRIGSRVHRVVRFDVPTPAWFHAGGDPLVTQRNAYNDARSRGDEQQAASIKAEVRAEIGRRVSVAGADDLLPRATTAMSGAAPVETQLACDSISHPEVTAGLGLALVDSFNANATLRAMSGVINNAYMVYSSAENLYLAQSSLGWFFAPQQAEETAVYRMALSPTGAAAYRGVGTVDGSVIGPYAFSEHAGFLRVASTETRFDGSRSEPVSHVSVLRVSDLAAVGTGVRNLAPGERIQGVRFLGDRGFVVTFRQIDPLFAIDLSNPAAPRVADELKIPGFSSYLAPIGDDYLLTVGRAGTEERLTGQIAVQLFDVRDLSNIRQLAVIAPPAGDGGYSYSIAEYDPHAFSYFADSAAAASPGTLSIPVQTWGDQDSERFAGFLVVRVEPGAAAPLRETGRIAHEGFADDGSHCGAGAEGGPARCQGAIGAAEPRRSVFMQDGAGTYLYTISALGVVASNAAAPDQELGRKELPYDPPQCCYATPGGGGGVVGPPVSGGP